MIFPFVLRGLFFTHWYRFLLLVISYIIRNNSIRQWSAPYSILTFKKAVLGFFKINAEKKRVHALEVSESFPRLKGNGKRCMEDGFGVAGSSCKAVVYSQISTGAPVTAQTFKMTERDAYCMVECVKVVWPAKACVEDAGTKQVIRNVTEIIRCELGMKKGGNAKYNSRPFKGTGFFMDMYSRKSLFRKFQEKCISVHQRRNHPD